MQHDATYVSKKTKQTVIVRDVPVMRLLADTNEPLYSVDTAQRLQDIINAALKSGLPYLETSFEAVLQWSKRKTNPKSKAA